MNAIVAPDKSAIHRILDAATRLFAARGFEGVSMTDLAQAANVSKANIFHHFANKEALYVSVLKHALADFTEQLAQLARSEPGYAERMRSFVIWHSARLRERPLQTRLLLRELLAADGERHPELSFEVFNEGHQQLVQLIAAGQQAGQLREDLDPAVVALTLVAVDVFAFLAAPTLQAIPSLRFATDQDSFASKISDLILHGALAPGARPSEVSP